MFNLVFIGGGHSHAIALKLWGEKPLLGINITLISNVENTPYSGMLPAYLAGDYNYQESHINLKKLCQFAKIILIIDEVTNINYQHRKIICKSGKKINFDLLSIDIGSNPKIDNIEGANLYGIPAKPVPFLLKKWQEIIKNSEENNSKKLTLTFIGGGAGGVELAINTHKKLTKILSPEKLTINLIHKGNRILSTHNEWVSYKLTEILLNKNINIYLNSTVKTIKKEKIILTSGKEIISNYHFLVTEASAPLWLKNSSIYTDKNGFILIKNTLQSINCDFIFATGDIATMINYPHPKAGVFAVKQGKPLYENLCNFLNNKPLKSYYPQKYYLNLIGVSNETAIASWGYFSWESPLLWHLKKYLDTTFMEQFAQL
jgi:pyridine nucleotide-disulfide oxidoreductase family protein